MNYNGDSNKHAEQHNGYGSYVMVWLILIGLTVATVAVSGINLGDYILFTTLVIASIKSYYVVTIFMHIKFEEPVFKVFIAVALLTLLAVFTLTAVDVFYR